MTKFYKATFSNGEVLLRSSTSRTYAAAYRLRASRADGSGYRTDGFSGTEQLAINALRTARAHAIDSRYGAACVIELAEVAPAVEITGPEHRTLRSLQRGDVR